MGWSGDGLAVGADEAVAVDNGGIRVEFPVVRGGEVEVSVDVVDEENAGAALGVDGGREPDVASDVGGAEVEAEALVDVEYEAATNLEVVEEVALAADEDAVLFVDPGGADEIAEDLLGFVVSFGVRVAGVVEDDGGATVEVDAAGVGEGAEFEDAGDGEDLVAVGVGVLAFAFQFGAAGLGLCYLFVDAFAFLLGFIGGERLAVAGHGAVDADSVDGEALGVGGDGLLYVPVVVDLLLFEVDVVGVVLIGGFRGFLVAFGVEEELRDWRERLRCGCWRGGLLRGCAGIAKDEREATTVHAAL